MTGVPMSGKDDHAQFEVSAASAGRALFWLGRFFGRQSLGQRLLGRGGQGPELAHILVVQAIEESLRQSGVDVTVGTVAARLDLDPSTASRLVAATLRAGYLARSASPGDARRAALALTVSGRDLAAAVSDYQRDVFLGAMAGWSAAEQRDFARQFVRFASALLATDVAHVEGVMPTTPG